jgi:2-C-methyl-D-erythritol 4-phosphate cytidylyltransferase
MGSDIPKPFLKVGGRSILEHTIAKFLEVPDLVQVIIATSEDHFLEVKAMFEGAPKNVEFKVVEGGKERQFSIYNALKEVLIQADLVAVHDAVRPFIRPELIVECCQVAAKYGGAVLGVPAKDTIKEVKGDNMISNTPDRSGLWQAQTPQVFQRELLVKAYELALKENIVGTDDASLVERIGGEVQMVEGDRENLKITYPIDFKIAKLIFEAE